MNGKQLLVLLLAAAAAVAALFFFDVLSPSEDTADPDVFDEGTESLDANRPSGSGEGTRAEGGHTPTLFGSGSRMIGAGDALGRVLAFDTREPVVGAVLRLAGTAHGGKSLSAEATSGSDGRFHFAQVPAGEDLVLSVEAGAHGSRAVLHLSVSAGSVEDFGTIWLGENGVLEGTVLDTLDQALVGADVQVHPGGLSMEDMMADLPGLLSRLDRDPEPIARGESHAGGHFRIPGIPPGPATLIIRHPGYQLEVRTILMSKQGVVGKAPVIHLEVSEPISGRVISQSGLAIAGARVAFMDSGDQETGFYSRQFTETDSDGSFLIESPPNAAQLMAIVAAEDYPTLVHTLKDGGRSGLVFVLVGGANITIRILKASGGPLVGGGIMALNSEKNTMGAMETGGTLLSGTTDARGEITVLARPGYIPMVMLTHPTEGGGVFMPAMGSIPGLGQAMLAGPKTVKVAPGDNVLELTKPAGYHVTGRVTGPDGEPLVAVKVGMYGQMAFLGGGQAVTDPDGTYTIFVPKFPAMMMRLEARAPGYVQAREQGAFEISDARPIVYDIQLDRAATVRGVVVAPDGTPLAGVAVRLVEEGASGGPMAQLMRGQGTGMTLANGEYHFDTVEKKKSYVVVASADAYIDTATKVFKVGASAEAVTAPNLMIQKGLDLVVRVLEPDGRVLKGARVDVNVERLDKAAWDQLSRWRSFAKVVTGGDGDAKVESVPDGKVTFTARAKGFAGTRKTLAVRLAEPPVGPIELRLVHSLTLSGVVIDADGRPVKDARVRVQGSLGGMSSAVAMAEDTPGAEQAWQDTRTDETDRRGRFELTDVVPADSISIHVRAQGFRSTTMTVRGRTDSIEVVLRPIDKDKQRRILAIDEELTAVYGRLGAAKDPEERQAIVAEMGALQQEKRELQAEDADVAVQPAEADDG